MLNQNEALTLMRNERHLNYLKSRYPKLLEEMESVLKDTDLSALKELLTLSSISEEDFLQRDQKLQNLHLIISISDKNLEDLEILTAKLIDFLNNIAILVSSFDKKAILISNFQFRLQKFKENIQAYIDSIENYHEKWTQFIALAKEAQTILDKYDEFYSDAKEFMDKFFEVIPQASNEPEECSRSPNESDYLPIEYPLNSYSGVPFEIKLIFYEKYLSQAQSIRELVTAAITFRQQSNEYDYIASSKEGIAIFANQTHRLSEDEGFQASIDELAFRGIQKRSLFLLSLAIRLGADINQYIVYEKYESYKVLFLPERFCKLISNEFFLLNKYAQSESFIAKDKTLKGNRAFSLLHYAVKQGWREGIELLLDNHADIQALTLTKTRGAVGTYGRSVVIDDVWVKDNGVLHIAIENNHGHLIPWLIDEGYQIDNQSNYTPLERAGCKNKPEMIETLFEHHSEEARIHAIHMAVLYQKLQSVEKFLELGIDPNTVLKDGNSLLHASIVNKEIAKCLVEAGADLTATNNQQETPLHLAIKNKSIPVALYMIEQLTTSIGADVTGRNPLHYACNITNQNNCLTLVEVIDQKFDITSLLESTCSNHKMPIQTAWDKRNFAAFIKLLDLGSKKQSSVIANQNNNLLQDILKKKPGKKDKNFVLALIDYGAKTENGYDKNHPEFSSAIQNQHHNQAMMTKMKAHINYLEKSLPNHPATPAKIAIFKDLMNFIACHQGMGSKKLLANWLANNPYNALEVLAIHRRDSFFNPKFTSSIKLLIEFAHNDKLYLSELSRLRASESQSFKNTVKKSVYSKNMALASRLDQRIVLNDLDVALFLSTDLMTTEMALSITEEQLLIIKRDEIKKLLQNSLLTMESALALTEEQISCLSNERIKDLVESKIITSDYLLQLTSEQRKRLMKRNISALILDKKIPPEEVENLSSHQAKVLNTFNIFMLVRFHPLSWQEVVDFDDMQLSYVENPEIFNLLKTRLLSVIQFKELTKNQLDYLIRKDIAQSIRENKITLEQAISSQKQEKSPGFFNNTTKGALSIDEENRGIDFKPE